MVAAPLVEVYRFFMSPTLLSEATADVDSCECLEGDRAHWRLVEKVDQGIRFRADYVVQYTGNGWDAVSWHTVSGNLQSEGRVVLQQLDAAVTEIQYSESVAPDLPITPLLATLFKPIVVREVKQGIAEFLDRIERKLGRAERSRSP
jgi:uncharacterized membrane protein